VSTPVHTHTQPCLHYGLRGVLDVEVKLSGPKRNLHSGVDGGVIREPMMDLVAILSTLASPECGTIKIAGIYDRVRPLTPEEVEMYENIKDFDRERYQSALGVELPRSDTAAQLLIKRWRQPTLSIHSISSGTPIKSSIIPASVSARVGLRLVPDQDSSEVYNALRAHIEQQVRVGLAAIERLIDRSIVARALTVGGMMDAHNATRR